MTPADAHTWFPEDPGQINSRLQESLRTIRLNLPLPIERILQPDLRELGRLAERIAAPHDKTALRRLALELDSRSIAMLFPLLTHTGTPPRLASRICILVRERASLTLYRYGWLAMQYDYPKWTAAQALGSLCRILSSHRQAEAPPVAGSVALISEIIAPDSPHFIYRLVSRLGKIGLSLPAFAKQYQLEAESPLGMALVSRYFLDTSVPSYRDRQNGDLFTLLLRKLPVRQLAAILSRFFELDGLGAGERNFYCQLIYRHIGGPNADSGGNEASAHPVWRAMPARYAKSFQVWINAATIGSHCLDQPEKARFYLAAIGKIERLERLDDYTLIIHFPGFVIADSLRQPNLAVYYGEPDQLNPKKPVEPDTPLWSAEAAVRQMNFNGIVGLAFDEEGIRMSRIFLHLLLQHVAAHRSGRTGQTRRPARIQRPSRLPRPLD